MEKENNKTAHPPAEQGESDIIEMLIKREAEAKKLEAENKTYEKKINKIEKSNTWKKTRKWRNIISDKKEREVYIKELEQALFTKEREVLQLKESLQEKERNHNIIDYQSIWRMAQEKKQNASLMDDLHTLIETKKLRDTNQQQLLQAIARLYINEEPLYKKYIYEKVLSGMKQEEIPEFMVRAGLSDEDVSLKQAASFRGSLTARMRKMQLGATLPEMLLDDKHIAYDFMKAQQIRVPKFDEKVYTLAEIEVEDNMVIKPADGAGGRGVYLVYEKNSIIDIKDSKALPNIEVLKRNMERDLEAGRVEEDAWMIEELIAEDKTTSTPARDVKFYCFYGKVGIILEIIRFPELKYCWWTRDGKRISVGKYDYSRFKGKGVSAEEIEMAEQVSKSIPAPFIRIDFLRGREKLVFGEFAPKPGNYDEFDEATDSCLGDLFLEAEARLEADLLDGKNFETYKQFITNEKDDMKASDD